MHCVSDEILVHPDYWEDHSKHGNPYDLALIRTKQSVIFEGGTRSQESRTRIVWNLMIVNFLSEWQSAVAAYLPAPARLPSPHGPFRRIRGYGLFLHLATGGRSLEIKDL